MRKKFTEMHALIVISLFSFCASKGLFKGYEPSIEYPLTNPDSYESTELPPHVDMSTQNNRPVTLITRPVARESSSNTKTFADFASKVHQVIAIYPRIEQKGRHKRSLPIKPTVIYGNYIASEIKKCIKPGCGMSLAQLHRAVELIHIFESSSNLTDVVYEEMLIMLMSAAGKIHLTPTIETFYDNGVKVRRSLNTRKAGSVSMGTLAVASSTYATSCNTSDVWRSEEIPPFEDCIKIASSDLNSIYKTFKNQGSSGQKMVIQSSQPPPACDPHHHPWADVLVEETFTSPADAYIYDVYSLREEEKSPTGTDCSFFVCGLCVISHPLVLKGSCNVKYLPGSPHTIQMCNKEKKKVGYAYKKVHGSEVGIIHTKRTGSLFIDVYNELHQALFGQTVDFIQAENGLTKGSILPGKCVDVTVAGASAEEVFYYAKCGSTVQHHKEHFTEEKRCRTKYAGLWFSWIRTYACLQWFWVIYIVALALEWASICLLTYIGFFTLILPVFTLALSPIAYTLYRFWPEIARCSRCYNPWTPWHCCPDDCAFCNAPLLDHDCLVVKKMEEMSARKNLAKLGKVDQEDIPKVSRQHVEKRKYIMAKASAKNFMYTIKPFTTPRNSYSRYLSFWTVYMMIFILIIYLLPGALANCRKCTQGCFLDEESLYESETCGIQFPTCMCTIKARCQGSKIAIQYSSSGSSVMTNLKPTNYDCTDDPVPETQVLNMLGGMKIYKSNCTNLDESGSTDAFTSLPRKERLWVLTWDSEGCSGFDSVISPLIGPNLIRALTINSLNYTAQVDQPRHMEVLGIRQEGPVPNIYKTRPIEETLEEEAHENLHKGKANLLQTMKEMLMSMRYNGSIYGRDHSIQYPDPPPYKQQVYLTSTDKGNMQVSMRVAGKAGSIASFRPYMSGKEVPTTFTVSLPEAAGVYSANYEYTTCKTSTIEVARYDECVGSCSSCFVELNKNINSQQKKIWADPSQHESIEYSDINTWGCEGKGCWTVNTGCLCGYCSNTPDPIECMDVYRMEYVGMIGLVCVGVDDEHRCEQVRLGEVVNRQHLQMSLLGSDEGFSSLVSQRVAVSRDGIVYKGEMNQLGEHSDKFGTPQYSKNLVITSKVRKLESSYTCLYQEDQSLDVPSCFKDTWNEKSSLSPASSFFLDSVTGKLFHIGSSIGTLDVVLSIPETTLNWEVKDASLVFKRMTCIGCFSCIKGAFCNMTISSSHTGLFFIESTGGTLSSDTITLFRGERVYTIKAYLNKEHPTLKVSIKGNSRTFAKIDAIVSLKGGNNPRTSVRNATNRVVFVKDNKPAFLSKLFSGVMSLSPINWISSMFSSNWVHWFLNALWWALLALLICLVIYFTLYTVLKSLAKRAIIRKKNV